MESKTKKLLRLVRILEISILILLVLINFYDKTEKDIIKNKVSKTVLKINKTNKKIKAMTNLDDEIKYEQEENDKIIQKLEYNAVTHKTDKKIAYLTFDDGPYHLTDKVLDLLKQNDVKATFFVTGKDGFDDKYKRIVNEGHTLANHTYYHDINKHLYESADSFIEEVEQLENRLKDLTGYKTSLVRFPGGSSITMHKEEIVNKLHNLGYNYVDWTCETGDGSDAKLKQKNNFAWYKDTCTSEVIVLLMHDYNTGTYNALQDIINDLKQNNYIILPLTNASAMAK